MCTVWRFISEKNTGINKSSINYTVLFYFHSVILDKNQRVLFWRLWLVWENKDFVAPHIDSALTQSPLLQDQSIAAFTTNEKPRHLSDMLILLIRKMYCNYCGTKLKSINSNSAYALAYKHYCVCLVLRWVSVLKYHVLSFHDVYRVFFLQLQTLSVLS